MPSDALEPISVPPGFWDRSEVLAALEQRDIGALFRLVRQHGGASQTRIGIAAGMPQSEVSLIMRTGPRQRRVTSLSVIGRIADGLHMPDRARIQLGLAHRGQPDADAVDASHRGAFAGRSAHRLANVPDHIEPRLRVDRTRSAADPARPIGTEPEGPPTPPGVTVSGDGHGSARGWPRRRSIVSGYLWKLIRESVNLTQFQLADELSVDVATVQGWESGRHPLASVNTGDLTRFRIQLLGRGAHPRLFAVLSDAIEADAVIDHAVSHGGKIANVRHHPLAATVHRRDLTNLITWPLTGAMPTQLSDLISPSGTRRGSVARCPVLDAEERSRLFAHLLVSADSHRNDEDRLLRRQAVYLLAFDEDPSTKQMLAGEHVQAMRMARRINDIPSWVSVRSAAVALAHAGDRDPLSTFVATGLVDQNQQIANLNYWAYWVGETRDIYTNDDFMRQSAVPWDGARLLEHLINRLGPSVGQAELYVHTVSRLLLARPRLFDRRPELRTRALDRVGQALDHIDLPARARQELSNVAYAIKLSDR